MPRRKTPDIMGDVLDGAPVGQPAGEPVNQHTSIPAQQLDSETVKVTLYLPGDVAAALDRAWAERRLAGDKVTKSGIATHALRAHLANPER